MTFEDFFIFEFDPTDFKVYSWINFDFRTPPMKHRIVNIIIASSGFLQPLITPPSAGNR